MSKEKKLPKNELVEQGEKIIKSRPKKGRGGTENFPTTIPESTKAEDVRRIGNSLMRWYKMVLLLPMMRYVIGCCYFYYHAE